MISHVVVHLFAFQWYKRPWWTKKSDFTESNKDESTQREQEKRLSKQWRNTYFALVICEILCDYL